MACAPATATAARGLDVTYPRAIGLVEDLLHGVALDVSPGIVLPVEPVFRNASDIVRVMTRRERLRRELGRRVVPRVEQEDDDVRVAARVAPDVRGGAWEGLSSRHALAKLSLGHLASTPSRTRVRWTLDDVVPELLEDGQSEAEATGHGTNDGGHDCQIGHADSCCSVPVLSRPMISTVVLSQRP